MEKIVGGKSVTFILNGKKLSIFVEANETLIDVLRNRLGLGLLGNITEIIKVNLEQIF